MLLAVAIILAVALGGGSENYKIKEVQGFDEKNETNICSWQQVSLVSKQQLEMGFIGGEGGQWPLCLTGDTKDGSLMFYGTNVGGLYRSTDGGKSWHKSMKDLLTHGVCDVEIDPNNHSRVVCFGTNGSLTSFTTGVYTSDDMGQSWSFAQHFPIGGDKDTDESLAFDPSSYDAELNGSAVLYLSLVEEKDALNPTQLTDETRGLYKSSDGGKSWQRINAQLGDGIVKVMSNGRLLVGCGKGLFASDDGGKSFTALLEDNVTGLDVIGNAAYALTDVKNGDNSAIRVWKCDNNGVTLISDLKEENVDLINLEWQKFYVAAGNDTGFLYHFSPAVHRGYSLKVSTVDANNMVMAYSNSAQPNEYYTFSTLYSHDGGKTWHAAIRDNEREDLGVADYNFLPHNTRKRDYYWSPTDKNKLWDFENDFASSSTDGGRTFFWDSNGINGLCIGSVFGINIFNSDLIYSGAQDYNGAFSVDGGKSWEYVNASGNSWGGHLYGGYPASEKVIFGCHSAGWTADRYLAISFDGGKTVTRHDGDANYKLSGGLNNRLNNQAGFVSYQAFNDKNVLFCGDLRSTDMGVSWRRMSGVTGVFAHDSENGFLYGVDDNASAVVFSEDNGASWQVLVRAVDLNKWWADMYISDIAVDSKNKALYIAAGWSKLYKVDIETRQISDITDNVPLGFQKENMPVEGEDGRYYFPRRITTVAVDSNHPEIVYVGGASYGYQSDSGLFRSCDSGKTFYALTSNSTTSIVKFGEQGGFEPTCIRVDSSGDAWVAGGCLGFSKINAPYETDETRKSATHKVTLQYCCEMKSDGFLLYDGRIALADTPEREGFVFDGWFLDAEYTKQYEYTPVTQDIVLYAKWRSN